MVVTPEEKQEMEKFMRAMGNGDSAQSTPPARTTSAASDQPIEANMAYGTEDVKEMKTILEKFYSADENSLTTKQPSRKPIREGRHWTFDETGRGRYQVKNRHGDVIARDLLVKESAVALSGMLNKGKSINDMGVVKLLALEQKYRSEVRKVSQAGTRESLAEARKSAMTTRNDIRNIAESL